jgi:hypothetical protein
MSEINIAAIKSEFLKAEILNICKSYVAIHADESDVTRVATSVPHPGYGLINDTDSQST